MDEEMYRENISIVRALKDLQRSIPKEDVRGKFAYIINTTPIKTAIDLEKEFWTTDAKKDENAVEEVMGSPLRNAKL